MSSFHLRPVSDNSPSPSPSASTTPPGDNSPQFKGPSVLLPSPPPSASANGRSRRPLSPSSLRDVDLTHAPDMPPRKYPTPPTGHDLMAMFPPAPPDNFPEMRAGPTSGYFQSQERAFFAQAGKEIVRVRVEVDLPGGEGETGHGKVRGSALAPRPWPPSGHTQPSTAQHQSPPQSSALLLYPHPNSRPPHRGPVPVTPAPSFPMTTHAQPAVTQPPPNLHPPTLHHPGLGLHTPPQEPTHPGAPSTKTEFPSDEYHDDPDEAWRRPMPYAERRRAGKHTRRVIVRN